MLLTFALSATSQNRSYICLSVFCGLLFPPPLSCTLQSVIGENHSNVCIQDTGVTTAYLGVYWYWYSDIELAYLLPQLAELARAHINVAPGEEATVRFFWLKTWWWNCCFMTNWTAETSGLLHDSKLAAWRIWVHGYCGLPLHWCWVQFLPSTETVESSTRVKFQFQVNRCFNSLCILTFFLPQSLRSFVSLSQFPAVV